jgi:hypothetical protein
MVSSSAWKGVAAMQSLDAGLVGLSDARFQEALDAQFGRRRNRPMLSDAIYLPKEISYCNAMC